MKLKSKLLGAALAAGSLVGAVGLASPASAAGTYWTQEYCDTDTQVNNVKRGEAVYVRTETTVYGCVKTYVRNGAFYCAYLTRYGESSTDTKYNGNVVTNTRWHGNVYTYNNTGCPAGGGGGNTGRQSASYAFDASYRHDRLWPLSDEYADPRLTVSIAAPYSIISPSNAEYIVNFHSRGGDWTF